MARRLAEVDGNRTRRTGITRPTRFEGGGAHQVPRHLRSATYRLAGLVQTSAGSGHRVMAWTSRVGVMKKLLLVVVLIALGAVAAQKLRVQ